MATLSIAATATASVTSMACSASASRMAGNLNIRKLACERQSMGIRPPRNNYGSASAAKVIGTEPPPGWHPQPAEAVADDTPVVGWRGKRVNTLRLWTARATDPMRLDAFNAGDHVGALAGEARAESACSRALSRGFDAGRPGTAAAPGIFLFLAPPSRTSSAATFSILVTSARCRKKAAIQLNDTHPAVAVAELMRLLIDRHRIGFLGSLGHDPGDLRIHQPHAASRSAGKLAIAVVRAASATAHADHLRDKCRASARARKGKKLDEGASEFPSSTKAASAACEWESGLHRFAQHQWRGRVAYRPMKKTVFAGLTGYPERISNKTNGITPRRWLRQCNPLSRLAKRDRRRFLDDAEKLSDLNRVADDPSFRNALQR